ncbi:hypothetical protein JMJ35_006428 [Cladonia borealis]|uniref:Uncharacterized protein n=1 Tax=Cladonia borealis TaxID=184061 RepID=A0AA39QZW9_9LECA|nr:hypothetical protein JMJ35_006428 [Cladonia borealis]
MSLTKVNCQIRVQQSESDDGDHQSLHEAMLLPLCDCRDVSIETRKMWTVGVMEHIGGGSEHISIRPWDFVARLDGSVESLVTPTSEDDLSEGYPARFQIPHGTLYGLETGEKVKRAAMASLLNEIMSGRKPFEELSDSELQNRFTRGDFPDDAATLPSSLYILSGWSEEFEQEIAKIIEARKPNKARKVSTGVAILGVTVAATALLAIPILGAVGFAAVGPVAGSAAAGWQASIGAAAGVAGFAGAVMGGAAMGGTQAAGVFDIQGLDEIFKRVYRTPERARGL